MATISIADIKIVKSGGAGNTDPNACFGGVISSAGSNVIASQSFTAPSTVTGVVILDAAANAIGVGLLKWDAATQALYWKPYGATSYKGLGITTSGNYLIGDSNGYLLVEVTYGSLPGLTQQDNITISYAMNNAFDNISPIDSLMGDVEYRCFYIKNTHDASTANAVKLWVKSQPTADDQLDIGIDPAGVGNGSTTGVAKTIVDESDSTNVLSGGTPITFSRPSSSASALDLGDLPAGSCAAFWIRRTVPSESTQLQNYDTCSLGIAATL